MVRTESGARAAGLGASAQDPSQRFGALDGCCCERWTIVSATRTFTALVGTEKLEGNLCSSRAMAAALGSGAAAAGQEAL